MARVLFINAGSSDILTRPWHCEEAYFAGGRSGLFLSRSLS